MEISTLIFYAFATILVLSSFMVISSRNPVHAALYLVLSFFTAASIWMLMHAEFLAVALVVIYVGAVMVLVLFVVMMLDINVVRLREGFWRYLPIGLVVAVIMVLEMGVVLNGAYFSLEQLPVPAAPAAEISNTKVLARALFTHYAYPFELASIVLLVAMIAAVMLTLRKRDGNKAIHSAAQIAVKAKDRVRIVSMPAEKAVVAAPVAEGEQ